MNYKDMRIEDIIQWCKDNNQVAWLKQIANKSYPILDEEGNVLRTRKITFIELKLAFVREFMPEAAPKAKEKKPSMYDLIADL